MVMTMDIRVKEQQKLIDMAIMDIMERDLLLKKLKLIQKLDMERLMGKMDIMIMMVMIMDIIIMMDMIKDIMIMERDLLMPSTKNIHTMSLWSAYPSTNGGPGVTNIQYSLKL